MRHRAYETLQLQLDGMHGSIPPVTNSSRNQYWRSLDGKFDGRLAARRRARGRRLVVAHLALQERDDQPPVIVADGVGLGVRPSLGSPETTGNLAFLRRLAAVRWAFKCVALIAGNPEKFGPEHVFQLTPEENDALRFQSGASNAGHGGSCYLRHVYIAKAALRATDLKDAPAAYHGAFRFRPFPGEDAVDNAQPTPADEAVIDGLVRV